MDAAIRVVPRAAGGDAFWARGCVGRQTALAPAAVDAAPLRPCRRARRIRPGAPRTAWPAVARHGVGGRLAAGWLHRGGRGERQALCGRPAEPLGLGPPAHARRWHRVGGDPEAPLRDGPRCAPLADQGRARPRMMKLSQRAGDEPSCGVSWALHRAVCRARASATRRVAPRDTEPRSHIGTRSSLQDRRLVRREASSTSTSTRGRAAPAPRVSRGGGSIFSRAPTATGTRSASSSQSGFGCCDRDGHPLPRPGFGYPQATSSRGEAGRSTGIVFP